MADNMQNMQHSEEEIRLAVEQGPITQEYKADPQQVVNALNNLRSTELASYLQYKQHAYMAVSLLSPGLRSEFGTHADQELAHADRLAGRIQQLGGVPIYSPQEIASKAAQAGTLPEQGATLSSMVGANLLMERRQVEAYTALIRELGNADPVTCRILIEILEQTEKHASELADYLKRTADTRQ